MMKCGQLSLLYSQKMIERDVEEEEGEMLRRARPVLSEEEIETLGERLQKARSLSPLLLNRGISFALRPVDGERVI
jgi:hypothetical protein